MATGEWEVGLLGCFSHCGLCIQSFLVPCIVYGRIARAVGKPCCLHTLFFFIPGFNFFVMCRTRGALREKREIAGGPCGDLLVSTFCTGCSLSQEAIELLAMVRDMVKARAGKELQDMGPGEPGDAEQTEELADGTEQPPQQEEDGDDAVETDKLEMERE